MTPNNPPPDPGAIIAGMICFFVPFIILAGYGLIYPARMAWRRGYNPLVWGGTVVATSNPVLLLVLLAMIPNRARMKLREQFAAELDEKLARVGGRPAGAVGGPAVRDRSIGDQVTQLPQRSIGDDQTTL
jgi:hypothetical protein